MFVESTSHNRKMNDRFLARFVSGTVSNKKQKVASQKSFASIQLATSFPPVFGSEKNVILIIIRHVVGSRPHDPGASEAKFSAERKANAFEWAQRGFKNLLALQAVSRAFYTLVATQCEGLFHQLAAALQGAADAVSVSCSSRFADPLIVSAKQRALLRAQSHRQFKEFGYLEYYETVSAPEFDLGVFPSPYANASDLGGRVPFRDATTAGPPFWLAGRSLGAPVVVAHFNPPPGEPDPTLHQCHVIDARGFAWLEPYVMLRASHLDEGYAGTVRKNMTPMIFSYAFDFAARQWVPLGLTLSSMLDEEDLFMYHGRNCCEILSFLQGKVGCNSRSNDVVALEYVARSECTYSDVECVSHFNNGGGDALPNTECKCLDE